VRSPRATTAASGQLKADRRAQQLGRLLKGEAQLALAQLGQLTAGPQPGQRQRRVSAASQHQPQRSWQVLQQEAERLVDRLGLDQVIVVQHQHDRIGHASQLVDQRGRHRLEGSRLLALQQPGDRTGNPWARPVQCGGDVAPEPHWVVVGLVQRQPGHRPLATPGPVGQQGGLAEAGRGADQHQLAGHPLGQPLGQLGAR
jgi:hypothetical protein